MKIKFLNFFLIFSLMFSSSFPAAFFNFEYIKTQIIERIRQTFLSISVNLSTTVGLAKTSEIFLTNTAQSVGLLNPDNTHLILTIPENILSSLAEIESKAVSLRADDILPYFRFQEDGGAAGPIYKIDFIKTADNSFIISLIRPITLTFFYADANVLGLEESKLKAYFWDSSNSRWSPLSQSQVFLGENKIVAQTDHLTLFGVFGPPKFAYPKIIPLEPRVEITPAPIKIIGDINKDGKVNLVDFSIMAYWWKRPLTLVVKSKIDLNGDGKLDLIDFSIMAYWWTK